MAPALGIFLIISVGITLAIGGYVPTQHGHQGGEYHDGGPRHAHGGHHQQPYGHGREHVHHVIDYYVKPQYNYEYNVADKYTGDYKSASEKRDGNQVIGHYQLREPDGSWRTVTYMAGPHSGFQAHVQRTRNTHPIGHSQSPHH